MRWRALLERFRIVNEIEIPMAQAILHLLHAAPLVGMRQQRLAQELDGIGKNGQLARARLSQGAVDAKQVAQVQLLSQQPSLFADLLLTQVNLNAPGPVLQVEKEDLAHTAPLHDAARDADANGRIGVGLQPANALDRLMAVEAASPGIDSERATMRSSFSLRLNSIVSLGPGTR